MASENKATWAMLRVGLMALVALAILGVLVFYLTGDKGFFRSKSDVFTYMDDSAALTAGSPVRLNGILVGTVTKVELSGSNEQRRIVRVDMKIEDNYFPAIPVDSTAAISAENLLGTKFINIKKGHSTATVHPGGEIASLDTTGFDDVVQQGYALLTSLQGILKRVDAIVATVEVGKGTIGKLLVDETLYGKVLSIADEGQKIVVALNSGKGTIGKLIYDDAVLTDVRNLMGRFDTLMVGLQHGEGTAGKLLKDPALYDDMRKTIGDVRQILADLNAGKGSAGKILKSDELHNQIVATMGRLDVILDKVNSGQGTIGQLLVNPSLYDSLNGFTRESHELIKDFRANPKKFLRIKLALF
ncbi:MAG: MlaD family protein [Bryobacteraceae bacterium]